MSCLYLFQLKPVKQDWLLIAHVIKTKDGCQRPFDWNQKRAMCQNAKPKKTKSLPDDVLMNKT